MFDIFNENSFRNLGLIPKNIIFIYIYIFLS